MVGDFGVWAKVTVDGTASASLSLAKTMSWCWFWGVVCGGGHGLSPSIYHMVSVSWSKQQGRERERTQLSYF